MIKNSMLPLVGLQLLVSLFSSSIVMAQDKSNGPSSTGVGVEQVVMQEMTQTIPITGRFIAKESGVVAARINGAIEDVKVQVGETVFLGQVLVSLVSDRLSYQRDLNKAELAGAKAELETAQAQLAITAQELKRLSNLRKSAAFNQARYDDKRLEHVKNQSAVTVAEAAVRRAEAELQLAALDLEHSQIRAPYPATVTKKFVEKGAYVSIGQNVLELTNAKDLEIEADVPTRAAESLKQGTMVLADLGEDKGLETRVRAVVPDENPMTRTRAVRFTPGKLKADLQVASNQTVTLHVPLGGARDIVAVPKDAIINKNGGRFVYVLEDGKANIRPVELGLASGGYFEVLQGLKPEETVVVRGNERLRPGQAIHDMDHKS